MQEVCHTLTLYFLHNADGTHTVRVHLQDASERSIQLDADSAEIVEWAALAGAGVLRKLADSAEEIPSSEARGTETEGAEAQGTEFGAAKRRGDN